MTYQDLPRPTIFAHRGSRAYAPENTMAAFKLAAEQGAPAIELDARLTADDEIVIFHDQTLERTTDGTGNLSENSLTALRELDAGSHFSADFAGEKIPTLAEVFESVSHLVFINIELKNYTSPRDQLPDLVAVLVKRFGVQERVMFSSFNHIALQRVNRLLPEVPRGFLALPGFLGAPARSFLGRIGLVYQAIHPEKRDATPRLIQKAHQRGQRVHVYTVNQAQEMHQLIQHDVDGIITDDPPLALDVLKQMGK